MSVRASLAGALGDVREAATTVGRPAPSDVAALTALTVPGAQPVCDLADLAEHIAAVGNEYATGLGGRAIFAGAATLSERERLSTLNHIPASGRSLRGATRLLATADGWVAMNLARTDDLDAIPALTLGQASAIAELEHWLLTQPSAVVVERAGLLGMALSALPTDAPRDTAPYAVSDRVTAAPRRLNDVRVLDLSRLWAGPLAGALLSQAGARVVRAIDRRSPPPVEPADAAFDERLNGRKRVRDIDFADRSQLRTLIDDADVVITSMRPSALARFPRARPDAVHLMISAHGAESDRAGFGDDCAVAGGLIAWGDGKPEFAADAIADPLTGMIAAVAALGLLAHGAGGRVDISLTRTATWATAHGRPS